MMNDKELNEFVLDDDLSDEDLEGICKSSSEFPEVFTSA